MAARPMQPPPCPPPPQGPEIAAIFVFQSRLKNLEERLLDQEQARELYTPPFGVVCVAYPKTWDQTSNPLYHYFGTENDSPMNFSILNPPPPTPGSPIFTGWGMCVCGGGRGRLLCILQPLCVHLDRLTHGGGPGSKLLVPR